MYNPAIVSFRGFLINAPPVTAMAAWAVNRDQRPFASPYRTVAPERSITSVVVYCLRKPRRRRVEASDSRSQIRGRDKSVLDDISPLPGTVGLRTVLRYAPFLEEWSTKHADARRNCDRLLTGSCTMDAWLAQCGFWRKVGEMQKQDGPRSIQVLDSIGAP